MIVEKVISRCASRREKRQTETYMQFQTRCEENTRSGKKQRLCDICGLWCWPEDRCAAFTGGYKISNINADKPMVEIIKKANQRYLEALELRRSGMTLKKIGDRLGGVTRERARQLVNAGKFIEQRFLMVDVSPTESPNDQ